MASVDVPNQSYWGEMFLSHSTNCRLEGDPLANSRLRILGRERGKVACSGRKEDDMMRGEWEVGLVNSNTKTYKGISMGEIIHI